jgi:hypothetical protein
MKSRNANTMRQLPATAGEYYTNALTPDAVWEREFIGVDEMGRRVYKVFCCGVEAQRPRALMTFGEFRRAVTRWAEAAPHGDGIGVGKWTEPCGDVTPKAMPPRY